MIYKDFQDLKLSALGMGCMRLPVVGGNDAVVDEAKKEQEANARPAIATELPPLDGYDTVFIGYPNW